MTLTGANAGSYQNVLFVTDLASSSVTNYEITFFFQVTDIADNVSLSAIVEYSSGSVMKYYRSGILGLQDRKLILFKEEGTTSSSSDVSVLKSANVTALSYLGGSVNFTLILTNGGAKTVTIDRAWDSFLSAPVSVSLPSQYLLK